MAAACALTLVACDTPVGRLFDRGLHFTLSYQHAHGLQAEAPVTYKGLTIGRVKEVRLDPGGAVLADVRIEPRFKATVYREADYVIERGPQGARLVAVKDVEGPRTPLQPDEVIQGKETLGDQAGRLLDRFGREALRAVQSAGSQMGQALDRAAKEAGQELERAQREAAQARERALRAQQRAAEELRKEQARPHDHQPGGGASVPPTAPSAPTGR